MGLVTRQFIGASQAWYRARQGDKRLRAAVRRFGEPEAQQAPAPETVWTVPAPPISTSSQTRADQWIKVDPTLGDYVMDLIQAAAPAVTDAYDTHMGRLAFEAWRQWPVSSGFSRSSLALSYSAQGEQFVGAVGVTAPYLYMIKGQPHRRFIERPGRHTAVDIGNAVLDTLQEGAQP